MTLNEIKNAVMEGKLKNLQIDKEFDKAKSTQPVDFNVMINGKNWKKSGQPVLFKDHSRAVKAANTISAKRMVTTQVVPVKRS